MSKNVINTERLTLRPVLTQDTDEIHKYAGDKSIDMMLFLPNDTVEQTAELSEMRFYSGRMKNRPLWNL